MNARLGVSPESPMGKEWVTVDGEPMRNVRNIKSRYEMGDEFPRR